MKIRSDFALLDVKLGRKQLEKFFMTKRVRMKSVVGDVPEKKIPVTITGYVTDQWGSDDGVSIEFCVAVTNAILGKPVRSKP
jgi:hypothetical protein